MNTHALLAVDGISRSTASQRGSDDDTAKRGGGSLDKLPAAQAPKRSKKKLIGFIVLLVIVWLIAAQVLAADRYEAVVNIVEGENKIGINPTEERLDFGDLTRTNGQSRFISVKNNGRMGKYVLAFKTGSIADIMTIKESSVSIAEGEEKRLEFTVFAPVSTPLGNYRGTIWVLKLPKPF